MELLALGMIVLVFILTVEAYERRVKKLEKQLLAMYVERDVNLTSTLYQHHKSHGWDLPFNVTDLSLIDSN